MKPKEPFEWTDSCETAFQELKQVMTTTPVLAFPNNVDPFILDTDASVIEWKNMSNFLCVTHPDANTTTVLYRAQGTAGNSHVYMPL